MPESQSDRDRIGRDEILSEIYCAFAGVGRGASGISWSECVALDNFESMSECEAARRSDPDRQWPSLVDDPAWEPFPGIGGFAFINSAGFRYYLSPTMVRFLRGNQSEWYTGHFMETISRLVDPRGSKLWSKAQLRCIARFIAFMATHDEEMLPGESNPWVAALERGWRMHLE